MLIRNLVKSAAHLRLPSSVYSRVLPQIGQLAARPISISARYQNKSLATTTEVLKKVDEQVSRGSEGRLFAIVHIAGKQHRITDGDIILVQGYWPPTVGDQIRLDKVLLAGGRDFTLVGTPLLQPGLVDVQATVIEKTLTNTKTNFKKKATKQYMRINFEKPQVTMVRINSIQVRRAVSEAAQKDERDPLRIF